MSARSWNSGTKRLAEIAEAVILNEEYDPNDKAYKKRSPADQAKYDAMQNQFDGNSKRHHEKHKDERESRGIKPPSDSNWYDARRTRERTGEEEESLETLLSNQKGNMLVWNSKEPKLFTAVSIESGEPKGYFADVTAKYTASVFDCINIARDEARASGEEYDEEADTAQHLENFIEDYKAESYKKD